MSDENLCQDEPAPRPAEEPSWARASRILVPAHDGGALAGLHLQRRIELMKKRRGGDSNCHCVHTCLACLKIEDDAELDFAYEAVMNRASEHNLVVLLDKWSTCWKHRGRTRAIGPHAYEKYCTLGFFGHGGVFGISKASEMKRACIAVNHFVKERFPSQTWTSIAPMPPHRDILNMRGHASHVITLENFMEGRVWVEDENGQ